ncbi:MAG: C40 family peptidase [Clostridia bacterium]|nr:C40 family peptidase [Clostridia bacterium]
MKCVSKITVLIFIMLLFSFSSAFAAITEQQGNDVAEFAKQFIEIGNSRKDENGFPLLTYALSGNWRTCIEIRTKGYNEELYYVKRNGYYIRNGKYLELGNKWCMDCGTTVLYLLKKTLGFELLNSQGEPWHVQDIYNDAARGSKSQYFDLVYKSVSVGSINYSKLQKGDIIGYYTKDGNHGMLYLGDGYIAHANRDMIRSYGNDKISGFKVSKLNHYFRSGTKVRVMRIKDGIIPEDLVVNGVITWPDNGETMDLLHRSDTILDENIDFAENVQEEVVEEPKYVATVEELMHDRAKKLVESRINSKLLYTSAESNSNLFCGPYMKFEVAKLQNDKNKSRI